MEAAVDWVVRLSASNLVRELGPLGFLTVSLPRTSPDEILGVRVTDRASLMVVPRLGPISERTWAIVGADTITAVAPRDSDRAAMADGYIAVIPMRVDEVDLGLLASWRRQRAGVPPWR